MNYSQWTKALGASAAQMIQRVISFLPDLLGAVAMVLLGWLLAALSKITVARLTRTGLAGLARNRAVDRALQRTGLRERIPRIVSLITYWVILLFFLATAIDKLELRIVTTLVSSLAYYLPRLLVGILIILAGFIAGNVAHHAVATAAASAGVRQGGGIARATQIMILFVGIVMGAEHMGINSTLLTVIATIVIGAVLGGAALAFALGSIPAVTNIISSHHVLKTYQAGQIVRIGGIQGRILEITSSGVILDSADGRVTVPAKKFSEEPSVLVAGEK
jgi:small-conductance mechanosensitive channel